MRPKSFVLLILLSMAIPLVTGCRSDMAQRRAKLTEDAKAIEADFAAAKDASAEAAAVNRVLTWHEANWELNHVGFGLEIFDAQNKQVPINDAMAMRSLPADGLFFKMKLSWSPDKEHATEELAVFKHKLISKDNLGSLLLE